MLSRHYCLLTAGRRTEDIHVINTSAVNNHISTDPSLDLAFLINVCKAVHSQTTQYSSTPQVNPGVL